MPQYKLSGVGYCETQPHCLKVPSDRDCIIHPSQGRRYKTKKAPEMISLDCQCLLSAGCGMRLLHCHKFHAHCWSLIERIIGSSAEERLDLLITALRDRWKEQPFEVDKLVEDRWEGHWAWIGFLVDSKPTPFTVSHFLPVVPYKERVTPMTDPFHIPILQSLIKRSRKRRCCKVPRFTRARIPFMTVSKTRPSPLGLPLDIQQLILDNLVRLQDVGNAVAAFHWQLPGSYWRNRFPCDLIFELDDIPQEDLDWQYLYTEVGRLTETSRGLQNRQRIFRILQGTRDRFFKIVEQDSYKKDLRIHL